MPRGVRRLLVLGGLAGALTLWRNRMLAANESALGHGAQPAGEVTRR